MAGVDGSVSVSGPTTVSDSGSFGIVLTGNAADLSFAGTTVTDAAGAGIEIVDNDGATSYLRYDGTSDATTTACSSGRRSQNEPTVAVNPRNTDIVVAGSNDYCTQIVNGDVWGRPVDTAVAPDGGLYISDDQSGTIYKLSAAS